MLIYIRSLKQTHKTQYCMFIKLSTKSMNDESKNVTRQSPIFCCLGQSYWSLLRFKFPLHSVCTSSAKPLSSSSFNVERSRDLRVFMARKHLSAEQEVNGNVAAMRSNFDIDKLCWCFHHYVNHRRHAVRNIKLSVMTSPIVNWSQQLNEGDEIFFMSRLHYWSNNSF